MKKTSVVIPHLAFLITALFAPLTAVFAQSAQPQATASQVSAALKATGSVQGHQLSKANLKAPGRSVRLTNFPDFATIAEGSTVSIALPDGRELAAHVNYSKPDPTVPGLRVLAAGFPNSNGGFTLYQNQLKGTTGGHVLLMNEEIAYDVTTPAEGKTVITERWKAAQICEGAPMPETLRPELQRLVSPTPNAPDTPPSLSSRPLATAVLYLDFDGEPLTSYPDWPTSNPGQPFSCAHSGLTAAEMTEVWRIVSEDYAPFNVDVTTTLSRYTNAAVGSRMRIIITGTDGAQAGAGLAWLNSFAQAGSTRASNVPCWMPSSAYIANSNVPITNAHRIMASASSHELGHTLGLSHDGTNAQGPAGNSNYFGGHGSPPNDWSPIMGNYWGVGNTGRAMVQWSKGEYSDANNTEDDEAIIANATNGFGYAPKTASSLANPVNLTVTNNQIAGSGLLEKSSDVDYFRLTTVANGTVTLTAAPTYPATMTPDVDIRVQLLDSNGNQIAANAPEGDLTATVSMTLAPGTYYLTVRASGYGNAANNGDPLTNGWSAYGSLGNYSITGTLPAPGPTVTITSPAHQSSLNAFGTIAGTAADGGAGIAGNVVNFTLYHVSSGQYWNGSGWQSSQASLVAPWNSSTGVWTWNGQVPNDSNGTLRTGQYAMSASTVDNNGNSSVPQSGVNNILFTIDNTPPTVAISAPINGSTITTTSFDFNGTAADNNGIDRVVLFLRRNADNQYWNGSSWISNPLSANLSSNYNSANQTWTSATAMPVPGSSMLNGSYNFIALAFDAAGNSIQADSVVMVDYHPVFTWTGGSLDDGITGNDNLYWTNGANWSAGDPANTGNYPGADAIAIVPSNGRAPDLNGGSVTVGALQLSGEFGNGTVVTTGSQSTWTGGQISGTWINAGTLLIDGASNKILNGYGLANYGNANSPGILINQGTTTWRNGLIDCEYGDVSTRGLMRNQGTLIIEGTKSFTGGGVLLNTSTGTLRKVDTGTVDFGSGSPLQSSGRIEIPNSGVVQLSGFSYINDGSVVTGPGRVRLTGTSNYVNGTITGDGNFELSGNGDWLGNSTLNGTISFHWLGGSVSGILSLGTMTASEINGNATKTINGYGLANYGDATRPGKLINNGALTFAGAGALDFQYGDSVNDTRGVLQNNGSLFIETDADMTGGGVIINTSLLKKRLASDSSGNGDTALITLKNKSTGVVEAEAGTLSLNSGGIDSGQFKSDAGSKVRFVGGTHVIQTGTSFTGAGRSQIAGGRVEFDQSVAGTANLAAGATLELANGGDLGFVGTFTGTGALNWTGGTISGNITIGPSARIDINGTAVKTLNGYGLVNYGIAQSPGLLTIQGTAVWSGTGAIDSQYPSGDNTRGAIINSGLFEMQSDSSFTSGGVLWNTGTVRKSTTAGATVFADGSRLQSSGVLDLLTGSLVLSNNSKVTDGSTIQGAGKLVAQTGTVNFNGAIGGNGTIEASGASLWGDGVFGGTLLVRWLGGQIEGDLTIGANANLEISGSATKTLNAYGLVNYGDATRPGKLTNNGTATYSGLGTIDFQYGNSTDRGVFKNAGTLSIQSDSGITGSGAIVNSGTWKKEIATGTTAISTAVTNTGTISALAGTLAFNNGGGTNTGTYSTAANTAIVLGPGTHTMANGVLIQGLGRTRIAGGTLSLPLGTQISLMAGSTIELTNNGLVYGNGTITGPGTLEWNGGIVRATLTIDSSTALNITGAADKYLDAVLGSGDPLAKAILNLKGATNFGGSGTLYTSYGSTDQGLINNYGAFVFNGTAAIQSGRFRNEGVIQSASPRIMNLNADFFSQSASGIVRLGIAGTALGTQYDQLKTSTVTLGGIIDLQLQNGFTPAPGDTFTALTYFSHTGTFDSVHSLGSVMDFQYGGSNILLTAKAFPADNTEWKQYYFGDPTAPEAQPLADPNNDGVPNALEYALGRNPRGTAGSPITAGAITPNGNAPTESVIVDGVRYMSFRYTRPGGAAALTDVTYAPERSATLLNPAWSGEVVEHSVVFDPASSLETVTVRSTHPMSEGRREFLHLKVTIDGSQSRN